MEKEKITKFPKGFFQMKRPLISLSLALKDAIPLEFEENQNVKKLNTNKEKKKNGKTV